MPRSGGARDTVQTTFLSATRMNDTAPSFPLFASHRPDGLNRRSFRPITS